MVSAGINRTAAANSRCYATAIGDMIEIVQAAFRAGIIWLTGTNIRGGG
jgi:hypothetical protein